VLGGLENAKVKITLVLSSGVSVGAFIGKTAGAPAGIVLVKLINN
jgi:hypothetical protein